MHTVELHSVRTDIACALTTHYGNLGGCGRSLQAQDTCHLLHNGLTAGSTVQIAQATTLCRFHACRSKA